MDRTVSHKNGQSGLFYIEHAISITSMVETGLWPTFLFVWEVSTYCGLIQQ